MLCSLLELLKGQHWHCRTTSLKFISTLHYTLQLCFHLSTHPAAYPYIRLMHCQASACCDAHGMQAANIMVRYHYTPCDN